MAPPSSRSSPRTADHVSPPGARGDHPATGGAWATLWRVRALVPAAVLLVALVSGCRRNTGAIVDAREPIADARVPGLYPCTEGGRGVIDLDPHKPLTLLVHGCSSSGARFKTLARVFEASGQQALCMNYNDRDSLNTSATQLAEALTFLQGRLDPQELTILGHSQGGLVARRALQADLPHPLQTRPGFTYRLVTVSTPFAGIRSSADCGKTWLHLLSLSVTVAVCLAVTGNKWTEIYPGSPFMRNPAPVSVTRHLQVQADERDTCRTPGPDGRCRVDDFVFGLDEQASDVIARDAAWDTVTLKAGHAAVVGENGVPPRLLIETLQREGILLPAPLEKQGEVDALLERPWADAGEGGPRAAVRRRLHTEAKQHLDTAWVPTLDGERLGRKR
jgi:pimeloyl-ACP methyl ester carboxylesterase